METGYTPLKRMVETLEFKHPDRVPVLPNLSFAGTRVSGVSIREFARNPEVLAKTLIEARDYYGYDGIRVGTDVSVEGEALGSRVEQPEDEPASLVEPVIKEKRDLARLKLPNPKSDGRMAVMVEASRLVASKVGHEVFVCSLIMGPMNIAGQLMGVQELMMTLIDDPGFFEELLDFTTEVGLLYGTELIKTGVPMIVIGEALCNPGVIGPGTYREHIAERHHRLISGLYQAGANYTGLHICGDMKPILEDVIATGVSSLDMDSQMDMLESSRVIGGRTAINGNVNPTTLLFGTTDDVRKECLMALKAKEGLGLVLGSGCTIAPNTPKENIKAMVQAAAEFGRFEETQTGKE